MNHYFINLCLNEFVKIKENSFLLVDREAFF